METQPPIKAPNNTVRKRLAQLPSEGPFYQQSLDRMSQATLQSFTRKGYLIRPERHGPYFLTELGRRMQTLFPPKLKPMLARNSAFVVSKPRALVSSAQAREDLLHTATYGLRKNELGVYPHGRKVPRAKASK